MLGGHIVKGLAKRIHPVVKDIGETDQHRQGNSLACELADQVRQADVAVAGLPVGLDKHFAVSAHIDIAVAPVGDVVDLAGVGFGGHTGSLCSVSLPVRWLWVAGAPIVGICPVPGQPAVESIRRFLQGPLWVIANSAYNGAATNGGLDEFTR